MLFWYVTWSVTVIVTVAGAWLIWHRRNAKSNVASYDVIVALYRIQRRLQVFQFKVATNRYAAYARRQMQKELSALRQQEEDGS
jgi:hypothetical protein